MLAGIGVCVQLRGVRRRVRVGCVRGGRCFVFVPMGCCSVVRVGWSAIALVRGWWSVCVRHEIAM